MKRLSLTVWSIIALGLGLGFGLIGHHLPSQFFIVLNESSRAFGGLWVSALQLAVLPLVITHLLAAISCTAVKSVGRLGVRALVLFVIMLVVSGLFAALLTPTLITFVSVDPTTVTAFANNASAATAPGSPASGPTSVTNNSTADWIATLLPTNLLDASVKGDIFPLLLFTAFFAMAVTTLAPARQRLLSEVFHGLAEAMLQLTRWILVVTPLGVFALTYALVFKTGAAVGGMLGAYVLIASLLMIMFTLLLYPASAVLGRTPISSFARACLPAQTVAASTRSSIASLPALVEGARKNLRLPETGTGFVLPLSVSLFKVNRPISSIVKLLLVAHVYNIQVRPSTLIIFLASVVIISFGTAGIPQSGPGLKTLPAYLAAGIPIEGVIVLEAVESIPDIFKTVLNVTGDMSATVILTRDAREEQSVNVAAENSTPVEGVS